MDSAAYQRDRVMLGLRCYSRRAGRRCQCQPLEREPYFLERISDAELTAIILAMRGIDTLRERWRGIT